MKKIHLACQIRQWQNNKFFTFCLATFLFIQFGALNVDACMPGYEAERIKLRQYLGIEWVSNGLLKMDDQKFKAIRHPNELNCDFSQPENCKWQNLKNGLDSLDFYLFKKEDNIDFPVVQVRPGPSKVNVGDQLIFVGDRRRSEQSAILSSWPIRCQNTTGKLTFTFWIYNGARVEVLILEEDPPSWKIFPEKPYIDCGTVTMNTECSVEIPPRDTPFRIAIRAYDISHPEGSFIMLDNIFYEAEFCKVSIDFGPDYRLEPLLTAEEGQFVQTGTQLSCHDFDHNCRWRNGGQSEKAVWKRGLTSPAEILLFNKTGTYTAPTAPFAFMYIEEQTSKTKSKLASDTSLIGSSSVDAESMAVKSEYKLLVSDPILCQSPEPSYVFRIDTVNSDFDNFVIIDDIEYDAVMCSEATNALDLGKNFYTTPMLSALLNRPVYTAKELACDFSKRALDCLWSNLDPDSETGTSDLSHSPHDTPKWEIGLGQIDSRKFQSLSNQAQLNAPAGDVGIVKFLAANSSAILVSETLRCIGSSGLILSLRFWLTGVTSLSVCALRASTFDVIDCQEVANKKTQDSILVDIPSIGEPMRIALKAESQDGVGIVAVDDILLEGSLCPNVAYSSKSGYGRRGGALQRGSATVLASDLSSDTSSSSIPFDGTAQFRPHYVAPDENVCRLLSCDFDNSHMCLYSSTRVAASVSMFQPFNNTAHTVLFDKSKIAMLQSITFKLNAPARLHFTFTIKRGIAHLHVCQDSIHRELDSCYPVRSDNQAVSQNVVEDFIELLPTDTRIYIIAKLDQRSRKAMVEIDNFELTDIENHKIC